MKRTPELRGAMSADDMFTRLVRSQLHAECVREYRFHEKRKWRFDYALPQYKIAIEIDGGVWTMGRHNRPRGYIADMEKFNEAAAHGWLVLKFTPQQQYNIKTLALLQRTVKQRMAEENAAKGGFSTQNEVFLDKK